MTPRRPNWLCLNAAGVLTASSCSLAVMQCRECFGFGRPFGYLLQLLLCKETPLHKQSGPLVLILDWHSAPAALRFIFGRRGAVRVSIFQVQVSVSVVLFSAVTHKLFKQTNYSYLGANASQLAWSQCGRYLLLQGSRSMCVCYVEGCDF